MSGRWRRAVAGKVLQGSSTTVNNSSGASRSEISLTSVVKKGLHQPRDDDESRDVQRRRHWDQRMTSCTSSDDDDDDSLRRSLGRLSISDLEPVVSRDVTTTDDSASPYHHHRHDRRRRRTDSERSLCERCGELLDHPKYHRRYNVRGELVPCKSLGGSTNNSLAATAARDESSPAHGNHVGRSKGRHASAERGPGRKGKALA